MPHLPARSSLRAGLLGLLIALALSAYILAPPAPRPAVLASPINAACLRVTPSTCKLHVDPFTITVAPAASLVAFQLQANGAPIYDFRSDVSNPPSGSYTPSLVKRDFAARCGQTYTLTLLARDSADPGLLNAGQVEGVACPQGTFTVYLPLTVR